MTCNRFPVAHPRLQSGRENSNRARGLLILTILGVVLFSAGSAEVLASPLIYAFDAGGGFFVPLDSGNRSAYGTGAEFSFGFSPMLSTSGTWLMFEVGYMKSAGHEYWNDPTFEMPEDKYWLVPIRLGVRRDVLAESTSFPIKFCLGAGFQTILTGWKDGYGTSYKSPTFGLLLEIRPELTLSGPWGLWLSNRMTFLGDVTYEDSDIPEINYSANSLQIGLSYTVHR
ncbi:MAG: porin family protein [Candidatus Eisenbacteria bacterium]|uniref:Porin family protein n=1 Tax=Eiseniibacteriota bacterium TaxID=2212470 RepID=A0A948RWM9_UNCEI|nr:porin family protein [Candidatus Eisenbacteria bacterium]MBU1950978.1 porin family protein [Candidatus Eisenbacteria bacterium]MBU2690913.1 porin family protein [Candidatus Eisenbacteria bacterium]